MRLRDVAEERERQRERVLGGGDRVRLGRVGDDDPALGRGRDVDVVDAGAGAADRPHPVGPLDQLGGHLRRRADHDRVELADPALELAVGPVGADLDVEALAQEVDAGVGDLLLDEDLGAVAHPPGTVEPFSITQSIQAVSASTSDGLDRREHADAQLVAAELAVGLDVDDAVVRAAPPRAAAGVDRRRRSRSCRTTARALRPGRRRTGVGERRERLGPAVEVAGEERGVRATHQSRPPLASIHSSWSASRISVPSAGVL